MSAREVKRRREGWVREGIVYEYIAAVPAKRAAVESKSVFSHRNRIGNALTIYGLDFYGSRRERRRLATLSSARPNASGRGSTTHSSGRGRRCVCPTSRRRRSRVGCVSRWGRWRSEACVGGTRRPRRLFAETGTSENTSPSSENPLARTPRGGVLMPDSRWTRATAREARRRRVLALGAAGILLGGGAFALALRHRERRKAGAVARVCHDTDDTPTPDRRF